MKRFVLYCFIILAVQNTILGQIKRDPRSVAMANAYTTIADGYFAVGYNPAMLAYQQDKPFMLQLFGFDMGLSGNFLSLENLNSLSGDTLYSECENPRNPYDNSKDKLFRQIKEAGVLFQLTDCVLIFTDTDIKSLKTNKSKHTEEVLAFIKNAKRTMNWNEPAFWRKLRYFLPDPVQPLDKQQPQSTSLRNTMSKKSKLEGGAELDISGVWTFTTSVNDGINDSGLSTTRLLQSPNGNSPLGGLGGIHNHTSFPASPIRKKQPHQCSAHSIIDNASFNNLRFKGLPDYHQ